MIRRALIIHCNDTESGELDGPLQDNLNFRNYLTSSLGGNWYNKEIRSLQNPNPTQVAREINGFLNGADYTFIIFTGHGFINTDDRNRQYVELSNGDIPISNLKTTAKRQTLIVDACRGFFSPSRELTQPLGDVFEHYTGKRETRKIFDNAVIKAEEGWTILYAASTNQTALDTEEGAAYLLSLLKVAENWGNTNKEHNILPINVTHKRAKAYLSENFDTIQVPRKNAEKRKNHFPFAVKTTMING
jgi:hypothetical protein